MAAGFAADQLAVEAGDRMVAINGHPIDLQSEEVAIHENIDLSQRPIVICFEREDRSLDGK